jgi:xanthine dehydrogenase accessory factor
MLASLSDGKPRLLHFGVSDDTAWDVGLACGGKITIFVEPLDTAWWQQLSAHADQSFSTITILSGDLAGAKVLIADTVYASRPLPAELLTAFTQAAHACPATIHTQIENHEVLIEVYRPQPRLIIVGGAHVAQALDQYAQILGFTVYLIDPRQAFATAERFPKVRQISHEYPDKALKTIPLDSQTYVAVLTHDPKIDDPALQTVLPSPVAYIGILSSRRTHEKRLTRLTELGVDPALFSRIHTPIGIEIGAQTPEEIALAIMAQIISVKNKGQSA